MGNRAAGSDLNWGREISPARLAFDRAFRAACGRAVRWLLRHWLFAANLSNGLTVLGALLSPYLLARGLAGPGRALFALYSLICAQNPTHSYFLLDYQLAMDQRMMAIYVSATLAGLLYCLLRARRRPLSLRVYLALAMPLAVDGFTQLFGWRESNWQLRTVTGALFGVASVWWFYPLLDRLTRDLQLAFESTTRPTAGTETRR